MRVSRWLPPLTWAAVILILTSIPGSRIPALPFANFDKVVHLTIYGVLGWLTSRAWYSRGIPELSPAAGATLLAIAFVSCFGAFDEWHQQYIPQRSMDFLDWAADTTGAAIGVVLAVAASRRRMGA